MKHEKIEKMYKRFQLLQMEKSDDDQELAEERI